MKNTFHELLTLLEQPLVFWLDFSFWKNELFRKEKEKFRIGQGNFKLVLWSFLVFLLEFCVYGTLPEDLEENILGSIPSSIWLMIFEIMSGMQLTLKDVLKYVPAKFGHGACYSVQMAQETKE